MTRPAGIGQSRTDKKTARAARFFWRKPKRAEKCGPSSIDSNTMPAICWWNDVEMTMTNAETVTVRELRTFKAPTNMQPASTLTAKKGRQLGEISLAHAKKGAEFVVLRESKGMEVPKHTIVEVVDRWNDIVSFYAEKKGYMTGPALVRMRSASPGTVPSRAEAIGRVLRGVGKSFWMLVAVMALLLGAGLLGDSGAALFLFSFLLWFFFCFFAFLCIVLKDFYNWGSLSTTFIVRPLPPLQDRASTPSSGSTPSALSLAAPLAKDSNTLG